MLHLTLILLISLFLNSCTKEHIVIHTIEKKPLKELNIETISKIAIPVREEGYRNFETTLITSQKELNRLLSKIKLQKNWQNKENFLNALELTKIDFTKYNFLIYRITEASDSEVLLVQKPIGDETTVTIKIGKNSEKMKREKMAYYALGYKVSKSISKIIFDNGVKKEIIKNSASTTKSTIPKNCVEWFDGCNSCQKDSDGVPNCTERFCKESQPFKCTKWRKLHSKQLKPEDEPSHHDSELEKLPLSLQRSNE